MEVHQAVLGMVSDDDEERALLFLKAIANQRGDARVPASRVWLAINRAVLVRETGIEMSIHGLFRHVARGACWVGGRHL